MEKIELLISEAESVFEICKNESNEVVVEHLVELCDHLEKSLLEGDGIEMVEGDQDSGQVFEIDVLTKIAFLILFLG